MTSSGAGARSSRGRSARCRRAASGVPSASLGGGRCGPVECTRRHPPEPDRRVGQASRRADRPDDAPEPRPRGAGGSRRSRAARGRRRCRNPWSPRARWRRRSGSEPPRGPARATPRPSRSRRPPGSSRPRSTDRRRPVGDPVARRRRDRSERAGRRQVPPGRPKPPERPRPGRPNRWAPLVVPPAALPAAGIGADSGIDAAEPPNPVGQRVVISSPAMPERRQPGGQGSGEGEARRPETRHERRASRSVGAGRHRPR